MIVVFFPASANGKKWKPEANLASFAYSPDIFVKQLLEPTN